MAEKRGKHTAWHCVCECGNETVVLASNLRKGHTTSCGCLALERQSAPKSHGMSNRPEYRVWRAMLDRCLREKATAYRHYGGRGITVCERWLVDFSSFYLDMGPRPTPKHTLERVKNHLGYGPDNCMWATKKTQARNRRSSVMVEFNGESRCLTEWAELAGVEVRTIKRRIAKNIPILCICGARPDGKDEPATSSETNSR